MATEVDINSGHDVSIYTCCGNYPNKSKLVLYKLLLHCNYHLKQLQLSNKIERFGFEVGVVDVDVRVSSYLKEELALAVDKRLWAISTIML